MTTGAPRSASAGAAATGVNARATLEEDTPRPFADSDFEPVYDHGKKSANAGYDQKSHAPCERGATAGVGLTARSQGPRPA